MKSGPQSLSARSFSSPLPDLFCFGLHNGVENH
jgi:hypothetical protein